MQTRQVIHSDKAPAAIGPYSSGIATDSLIFTAGQLGINPHDGSLVDGGIQAQTRQALTNLSNVLTAAGSSLEKVVKTTVFLAEISDFQKMNEVYGEFFQENFPARSAFQVGALPRGAAIEIEAIALR